MRGLLLLYLGLWVFLGPSTEDVEHISATLLCIINLKQFASKALEGRGEIYHMTNLPKNNQLVCFVFGRYVFQSGICGT